GVGRDSTVVTVFNVSPKANAGGNQTVNEGSLVTLAGTFTDPGTVDTFTFNWHVVSTNGQVVPDGSGQNFSFTPNDNGLYIVTFTVTDDDGGVDASTIFVTGKNVAPAANPGANHTV